MHWALNRRLDQKIRIPYRSEVPIFLNGAVAGFADLSPVDTSEEPIPTPIFWHPNCAL